MRSRGRHFEAGELVWTYSPLRKKGRCPKLDSEWIGPCRVLERMGEVVYRVQLPPRGRRVALHRDRLAPYRGTATPQPAPASPAAPRTGVGPGHAHLSVLALGPHLTLSLSPLPVDHHSQQLGPQTRPSLSPCPPPGLTLVGPSRPQALLPSPPWPQRGLVGRGERRVASETLFVPSRTRNFEGGRQCSDPGTVK